MALSLEKWLEQQGFPHGFECIGIERMQQVWDAARESAFSEVREAVSTIDRTPVGVGYITVGA